MLYTNLVTFIVLFKCKQPLEAISKLNSCLADIMMWMVTN